MIKNLLALLLVICALAALAESTIYYPRPESASDPRAAYPMQLLEMAISKSGAQYRLQPSKYAMQQGRAIREIEMGSGLVHVVWSMTSREREQQTLPIRIPLDKGLLGWRLSLLMQLNAEQFKNIKSSADLRRFDAGQGHDWPDKQIPEANGLPVIASTTYDGLFRMLEIERIQYFPRSVLEIWGELELRARQGLQVDSYIALHYPAALYFFVGKNNPQLAADITRGLEAAIADGSFDLLFHQYHDESIHRAGLDKRMVIELNNPLLPAETPLWRRELWFRAR